MLAQRNFTQPSIPAALNTSTPVLSKDPDGAQHVYIIPLDDEECSYHEIKRSQQKAIIVDELDMLATDGNTDIVLKHPLHTVQDVQDSMLSDTKSRATNDDTDHTTIVTEETLHEDSSICTEVEEEFGSTTLDEAAHSLVYGMIPDRRNVCNTTTI